MPEAIFGEEPIDWVWRTLRRWAGGSRGECLTAGFCANALEVERWSLSYAEAELDARAAGPEAVARELAGRSTLAFALRMQATTA